MTSLLDEPALSRLVGVALRATCWASSSSLCKRPSSLTTRGGAEDNPLIVTCIYSRLSWVALVESLDYLFCIVQIFCRVPDFIVFW